jgi:hypothetical protein
MTHSKLVIVSTEFHLDETCFFSLFLINTLSCHKKYLCDNLFNVNKTHIKLPLRLAKEFPWAWSHLVVVQHQFWTLCCSLSALKHQGIYNSSFLYGCTHSFVNRSKYYESIANGCTHSSVKVVGGRNVIFLYLETNTINWNLPNSNMPMSLVR